MTEPTKRELQEQIQQLRTLVLSLSAKLLCEIVTESETHRSLDRGDAERFVREAEDCFRCARIPGLSKEIAEGLEVAGRELMARAVEIETALQRAGRRKT